MASVPVSIIALVSLNFGLGLHIWDQKAEWGVMYGKVLALQSYSSHTKRCSCKHTAGLRSGHTVPTILLTDENFVMHDLLTPLSLSRRPHVLLRSHDVCITIYGSMYIPHAVPVSNATLVKTISADMFRCTPIRGYWDVAAQQSCINIRATLVVVAALNSVSDILVYLFPAKPLWSLQLPLKRRLGLISIFTVGLVVCVAGICRFVNPQNPC
jgi:hypothetical protein